MPGFGGTRHVFIGTRVLIRRVFREHQFEIRRKLSENVLRHVLDPALTETRELPRNAEIGRQLNGCGFVSKPYKPRGDRRVHISLARIPTGRLDDRNPGFVVKRNERSNTVVPCNDRPHFDLDRAAIFTPFDTGEFRAWHTGGYAFEVG